MTTPRRALIVIDVQNEYVTGDLPIEYPDVHSSLANIGRVQDATGKTLSVSGLWALSPGNSASAGSYDPAGSPGSELYFTAGPNHGTGGLFGYLNPVSTELTVGNDQ